MHSCPFCKAKFEYKDILFYMTREMTTGSMGSTMGAQRFDGVGGSIFDMSLDMNPSMDLGDVPAAADSEPRKEENPEKIGVWAPDNVYYENRARFSTGGGSNEERFIVHWDPENASPGVAKADLWHDENAKDFPLTVQLCEADQASAGSTDLLTNMICPHCHFEIPKVLLEIPDENCHSIALIGYPSSGKTVYKFVLNQEIKRLVNVYNLVDSVSVFVDAKELTEGEANEEGKIEATVAGATVCPLVFAIKRGEQSFLISVYDLPGEVYREDTKYVAKLAGNYDLFNSDGAMLLVDPVQLYADLNERSVVDKNGNEVEIQYVVPDTDITAPLTRMEEFQIGKQMKYMALVLTKADLMFSGECGDYFKGAYLRQLKMCHSKEYDDWKSSSDPGSHQGHFGKVKPQIINAVDNEVMRVIDAIPAYDWQDVKAKICSKVAGDALKPENIRAFAVSTLRRVSADDPDDTQFVMSNQAHLPRHRILEPLLYLLARWNVVESENNNWGPGTRNPIKSGAAQRTDNPVEHDDDDDEDRNGGGKAGGGWFRRLFGGNR
ncbi:MAG: hypothetical protein Q4C10_06435 [Clostridia bacterium]|nr:hypothetical protein [Clostridia bacterium]